MQILVVDDELVSRTKMKTLMGAFGQCQTAENGTEAVRFFEEAFAAGKPFQLIMLDIEMPDLTGTEVLQQLRRIEVQNGVTGRKKSKIVMVTAHSGREQVVACIQSGCDDYIAKPFNYQVISGKLKGLGFEKIDLQAAPDDGDHGMSAKTLFKDINRALHTGEIALPMQPEISIQFRRLLDGNASVEEIGDLLQKDMVIAAKVIRVANSALYRGFERVLNAQQAVGRLGLTTTEQMVTALANQQLYANDQPKYKAVLTALWEHSLATAYAAQIIAATVAHPLSLDAFVAGLVHDIGALALVQIIAEMEKRKQSAMPITTQALTDTVQTYHATFGGKLLKKWNFAFPYIQAAINHRSSGSQLKETETAVVHLANLIAKSLGYPGMRPGDGEFLEAAASTTQLGLTRQQLDDIAEKSKNYIDSVRSEIG